MSKYVKGLLQQELEKKFVGVSEFLVLETRGVDGNENNEMRGVLKEKGICLSVVKNAMMCRAMQSMEMDGATALFQAGPSAVAYGGDSVVDVAKEVNDWVKKIEAIKFKGAFVDGSAVDADGATALAKMKSRVELQGDVVMLANAPGANLAGAIAAPGGIIAGCIEALVEKLEEAA
jgi:large subunit ribosomal protein L10